MSEELIEVYTDGSCHTQRRIGAWVAIVFAGTKKRVLSGIVKDTTHNRMELLAVIKAIQYVKKHYENISTIRVCTDSQYVTGLPERKEKIELAGFITGKGNTLQNADLVKTFFETLSTLSIEFIKIKAHQRKSEIVNFNREADMLSRKLLRNAVDEIGA